MKAQRGFTLIELVIVITIVGILAAVALPRFVNLQGEARAAKLNSMRGAVASASALVHAAFLAKGNVADVVNCPGSGAPPADNTTTLCTEAGKVAIANGYPATAEIPAGAGAFPGIVAAAGLSSVVNPDSTALQAEGYDISADTGTGVTTFRVQGATTPADCVFTYTQPAVAGGAPSISAVTKTGC